MKPDGSLPWSQKPITCPHCEPDYPVNALPSYSFKIYFNIILTSTVGVKVGRGKTFFRNVGTFLPDETASRSWYIFTDFLYQPPMTQTAAGWGVGEFLCGYDDRNELYIHLHQAQRLKCDIPFMCSKCFHSTALMPAHGQAPQFPQAVGILYMFWTFQARADQRLQWRDGCLLFRTESWCNQLIYPANHRGLHQWRVL